MIHMNVQYIPGITYTHAAKKIITGGPYVM